MRVEVSEETLASLEDYASIRMSFEVERVLEVVERDDGSNGFSLLEQKPGAPYIKDYDAIESPLHWPAAFDVSNWGVFVARSDGLILGGATVAFDTPGVTMLEDRRDLAVLWDIRVATGVRGQGIGTSLFTAVEKWAVARSCLQLKVETQNINFPACSFYAKQGCTLRAIRRCAYPEFPNETQLLWYKDL